MHLVIDLANQVILASTHNESLNDWIQRVCKRIDYVQILAKRLKLTPIFVCDVGYITDEVKTKWKMRREKELERGSRKIPYAADTLICELLLRKKLYLVYDDRYNADDIIATIANMHPKSKILSRDMDFFRYDNNQFCGRIFYIGGARKLTPLTNREKREPLQTIRMYFPIFATNHTVFQKINTSRYYIRGTAHPQGEKQHAVSLHKLTQKYRACLYTQIVEETFPMWEHRVVWNNELVEPSNTMFPSSVKAIVDTIVDEISSPVKLQEGFKMTIVLMACELMASKNANSLMETLHEYDANAFDAIADAKSDQPSHRAA